MKVKCSQCGGDLEIKPFDRILLCPYCKSHLVFFNGRTFSQKLLQESINLREIKRRLYRVFVSKVGESVNISEISLNFIPFVEIGGDRNLLISLLPALCEIYFVPSILSTPAGEYRFLEKRDFETSNILAPDGDLSSYQKKYGKENVKGLVYIPFYLVDGEFGEGVKISFSIDGYSGTLFCPVLDAFLPRDEKKDLLKRYSIHFFLPIFLSFPFYFIFKNSFLDFLGVFFFFYVIYLFYREENLDE